MQQDIRREAWSAPARRKIAPGQAKNRQAAQLARKKLPEIIHQRSKHSSMSATGLPQAGEVLPTPARPADDVGKASPHVITRHLHAEHKHSSTSVFALHLLVWGP
jgi:hypothetical protein